MASHLALVVPPAWRQALDAPRPNAPASLRSRISVVRASAAREHVFLVGGFSDDDSGGWLLVEIERNLWLCLAEKTAKVAAFRHKYPEWWLIFADQIGYGLGPFERQQFRTKVRIEHTWDRVILVSPVVPTYALEL